MEGGDADVYSQVLVEGTMFVLFQTRFGILQLGNVRSLSNFGTEKRSTRMREESQHCENQHTP